MKAARGRIHTANTAWAQEVGGVKVFGLAPCIAHCFATKVGFVALCTHVVVIDPHRFAGHLILRAREILAIVLKAAQRLGAHVVVQGGQRRQQVIQVGMLHARPRSATPGAGAEAEANCRPGPAVRQDLAGTSGMEDVTA